MTINIPGFSRKYARAVVLLAVIALGGPAGCHLIFPYEPQESTCLSFQCATTPVLCTPHMVQFPPASEPAILTARLENLSSSEQQDCYRFANSSALNNDSPVAPGAPGLVAGVPAYCSGPWAIHGADEGEPGTSRERWTFLKGAAWIPTRAGDRGDRRSHFLSIHPKPVAELPDPQHPFSNLYIAYDARVGTDSAATGPRPPTWLTREYEPRLDLGGRPLSVTVEDPASPGDRLELRLWRRKTMPEAGVPIVVPGNKHGDPVWPASAAGKEAMYMVILAPARDYNCNLPIDWIYGELTLDNCAGEPPFSCPLDAADAEAGARSYWESNPPKGYEGRGITFPTVTCETGSICPSEDKIGALEQTLKQPSYEIGSEIRFERSSSKVDIAVHADGVQQFTSAVEGTLHFDYDLDALDRMATLKVKGMTLRVDDTWEFQNIVVSLLSTFDAFCDEANAPAGRPCTTYRIPAGVVTASLVGEHGSPDKKVMVIAANEAFAKINIDHATREFTVAGQVSGELPVNGVPRQVDVDIDVAGRFHNFVPRASAKESKPFSGCTEYGNRRPIQLDASASLDIDDTYGAQAQPAHIVSYQWYQDYSGPTHKLWGTGKRISIPAHSLPVGEHDFTLMVRDDQGASARSDFKVTVYDKEPPAITPPADVQRLVVPPDTLPAVVALGKGSATDACVGERVWVSHDGPADGRYGAGKHVVTWTADDGHGNTASATQHVTVYTTPD